jgi:hypothetical protein
MRDGHGARSRNGVIGSAQARAPAGDCRRASRPLVSHERESPLLQLPVAQIVFIRCAPRRNGSARFASHCPRVEGRGSLGRADPLRLPLTRTADDRATTRLSRDAIPRESHGTSPVALLRPETNRSSPQGWVLDSHEAERRTRYRSHGIRTLRVPSEAPPLEARQLPPIPRLRVSQRAARSPAGRASALTRAAAVGRLFQAAAASMRIRARARRIRRETCI